MPALWNREPALVVAFIAAAIALGIGFGLPVTAAQEALTMTFVLAGMGLVTRSQVTPAAVVVAQVDSGGAIVAGPAHPMPTGTPIQPDVPPDPAE